MTPSIQASSDVFRFSENGSFRRQSVWVRPLPIVSAVTAMTDRLFFNLKRNPNHGSEYIPCGHVTALRSRRQPGRFPTNHSLNVAHSSDVDVEEVATADFET